MKIATRFTRKKLKEEVKKDLNINTWNKYLFIFETILFIAVIEEFLEGKITNLEMQLFPHILLVMLLVGTSFTGAVRLVEPILKGSVTKIVRFSNNKIIRITVHVLILFGLFVLYGLVYFDTLIKPMLSIGLATS